MRYLAVVAAACVCLTLISCSSGPSAPQPGTPGFYWGAAQSSYRAGDYLKTNDTLNSLLRHENEFTARGEPWSLVLSAGITHGLMELADTYDKGSQANKTNFAILHREASALRTLANTTALSEAELFHSFRVQRKDAQIALAFEFPPVNPPEPPALQRVSGGTPLPAGDLEELQNAMVQRGVIFAISRVLGADDPIKAQEVFKKGDVRVSRERFLTGMAESLFDQAELYDRKHINDPRKASIFCNEAAAALQGVPQDKEVNDLLQRIQKTQKTLPTT
ncbi:MAG TPA: hypothetical protein VKU01_32735 [Bryobacteraceae bacterium]|nr:hypothetical protein [Bryobacteraceae bacterium]